MFYKNIILFCSVVIILGEKVSYDGDQVWRLYQSGRVRSDGEADPLQELLNDFPMDTWSITNEYVDVRIPQKLVEGLKEDLIKNKISFDVKIKDVGSLINHIDHVNRPTTRAEFTFDQYHTYDEIMAFLDQLELESELVTSEVIGRTNENREIRLMKISTANGPVDKPVVWIDCGIHAREWISPATCLWGLNYLTSQYGLDAYVTDFLDQNDLYILPVLNADGYDFTWTNDRLWRKNRMRHPTDLCIGVDLNRNYDDGHWGGIGSSNVACAETYHGPTPFSELETSTVRGKILSIQETSVVKAFFSIHSYGQLWLFAFGWTSDLPAEVDDLYRVSQVGVDGIASVFGTQYVNGPHYTAIYPASGTAVDWGYSVGIVNTFIVELRDTGTYGFLLPEDQILPTAQETWTGLVAAINAI